MEVDEVADVDVVVDVVGQTYRRNIEGFASNILLITQNELRYWLMSF